MSTQYIELSAPYMLANKDRGKCVFCGECDGDKCKARFCNSCTAYWRSPLGKDLNDGRPAKQYCPDCRDFAELVDSLNALNPTPKEWLDSFCHECEQVETFKGSVNDFAELLVKKGWRGSLTVNEMICPKCLDREPIVDPVVDEFWAAADREYSEWKADQGR